MTPEYFKLIFYGNYPLGANDFYRLNYANLPIIILNYQEYRDAVDIDLISGLSGRLTPWGFCNTSSTEEGHFERSVYKVVT